MAKRKREQSEMSDSESSNVHCNFLELGRNARLSNGVDQAGNRDRLELVNRETMQTLPSLSPTGPLRGGESLEKWKPFERTPCVKQVSPVEQSARSDLLLSERASKDPIAYWVAHRTWPDNLEEMLSKSSAKRNRTPADSECEEDKTKQSYSESRKAGDVPQPYSPHYEKHIVSKGMFMNTLKGEPFVSDESKKLCVELQKINRQMIGPTCVPASKIKDFINDCDTRNETMVNREITQLILPSIRMLYYSGEDDVEHICDEVNAIWNYQCFIVGPRPQPDLAVGFFPSAFNESELMTLNLYTSVDNWTRVTSNLYFPFLMVEVKSGTKMLDRADRQNMHSCSVAVRAILRIIEEADKYRDTKQLAELSGRTLVFSISHDQQNAKLYGHYAVIEGDNWRYYRYPICLLGIFEYASDLLTAHNFARNVVKEYSKRLLTRLKEAIAVLPDGLGCSLSASEKVSNDLQAEEAGFEQ